MKAASPFEPSTQNYYPTRLTHKTNIWETWTLSVLIQAPRHEYVRRSVRITPRILNLWDVSCQFKTQCSAGETISGTRWIRDKTRPRADLDTVTEKWDSWRFKPSAILRCVDCEWRNIPVILQFSATPLWEPQNCREIPVLQYIKTRSSRR
jgi:hypothetical protein